MTGTQNTHIALRSAIALAACALALLVGGAHDHGHPHGARLPAVPLDEVEEHEDDELEGIAGQDRVVVNPAATIEAAFVRESYRPGERASLRFFRGARNVTVRLFHAGPERIRTRTNDMMFGVEVGRPLTIRSVRPGTVVALPIGEWA